MLSGGGWKGEGWRGWWRWVKNSVVGGGGGVVVEARGEVESVYGLPVWERWLRSLVSRLTSRLTFSITIRSSGRHYLNR